MKIRLPRPWSNCGEHPEPEGAQRQTHDPPRRQEAADAITQIVQTSLAFGQPYMDKRIMTAVGQRCAARGLTAEQTHVAVQAAGLVSAGLNTHVVDDVGARCAAQHMDPYQQTVAMTAAAVTMIAKRHGVQLSPNVQAFRKDMEAKTADLPADPSYYHEIYTLVAAIDGPDTHHARTAAQAVSEWHHHVASLIRDVMSTGGR